MKKAPEPNLPSESLMSKAVFKFKQFSIRQEKSAMKVGTDGVLLGAWTAAENPKHILDIGTGTGLIALMLAQRFEQAEIVGIDKDWDAFEEASFNFEQSPFSNRLKAVHSPAQNFESAQNFDLIVSNPPFFEPSHPDDTARSKARQQSELSFAELLESCSHHLTDDGNCAFIIPFNSTEKFIETAARFNLFPNKLTFVRGHESAGFKRSLLSLSGSQKSVEKSELTIEISRNNYTRDYINLTRDFYLKM